MNLESAKSFKNKTVLITGATGPLGVAFSGMFASMGAKLILTDIDIKKGEALVSKINKDSETTAKFVAMNLEKEEERSKSCKSIVESVESLDVLINNAALTGDSEVEDYVALFSDQSDLSFARALTVNLLAPFSIVRNLLPLLEKSSTASIINIASIYGLVGSVPTLYGKSGLRTPAAYAASKGGLIQLTRYLATSLAPKIRVNAIAPGGIERNQDAEFIEAYANRTPLGRMATEQDICGAVRWLASSESSYVTGQVIAVDGGWTAW